MVTGGRRHVMMGASQLDRFGNQNISCIGDWERPARQLLGVRGAPVNTLNNPVSYWVPRHSPRVFVERVDMVSGVGYDSAAAAGPSATRYHRIPRVVSDLAVFDFDDPGPLDAARLRASRGHGRAGPGGHRLPAGDRPTTSRPPGSRPPSELRLIREVIDPEGLRDREVDGP